MENTRSESGSGKERDKTTLFEQEQNGVTYRIPALIYLKNSKTFLAFAEKRDSPKDCDAKILVMRRGTPKDDGTVEWSSYEELTTAALQDHRTMNPCPVYEEKTKTLFLFCICVEGKITEQEQIRTGKNSARLCYVTSSDDGESWSEVKDLTKSVIEEDTRGKKWATFALGPGHGIQLKNGRLIIPAHAHYDPKGGKSFTQYAVSIYRDDSDQKWKIGTMFSDQSGECQMAEIIDGEGRTHVYCNARTKGGFRCEALSRNGGESFDKPPMALELVEQSSEGCQGSVIGFVPDDDTKGKACCTCCCLCPDTQTWLLFMHPTNKSHRKDMGVYLNQSPLKSSGWNEPWIIHKGPSGYSDLAYNEDKKEFSGLMECGEKNELEQIAFFTFTLDDVGQKERKNVALMVCLPIVLFILVVVPLVLFQHWFRHSFHYQWPKGW